MLIYSMSVSVDGFIADRDLFADIDEVAADLESALAEQLAR